MADAKNRTTHVSTLRRRMIGFLSLNFFVWDMNFCANFPSNKFITLFANFPVFSYEQDPFDLCSDEKRTSSAVTLVIKNCSETYFHFFKNHISTLLTLGSFSNFLFIGGKAMSIGLNAWIHSTYVLPSLPRSSIFHCLAERSGSGARHRAPTKS